MRRVKRIIAIFCVASITVMSLADTKVSAKNIEELSNCESDLKKNMQDILHEDYLGEELEDSDAKDENVSLLIELEEETDAFNSNNLNESKEQENKIKNSQKDIISKVEEITNTKVKKSFGYLVNGFSIDGNIKDIEKIEAISGIKSVNIDKESKSNMSSAKVIEEADKALTNYGKDGSLITVAVIDTGIDPNNKEFQNIDKENVKITKSDAENFIKSVGHGIYINDKIPFAYNYAAENNNVYSKEEYHGMHVAGIIAANGSEDTENSIVGVASNSQILALRTSNSEGSFHNEDIIEAIEDAVLIGADIINMSIGSENIEYSCQDALLKKVIDNATKKGILVVKAAGNEQNSASSDISNEPTNALGIKDTRTISSDSLSALSVASLENTKKVIDSILSINFSDGTSLNCEGYIPEQYQNTVIKDSHRIEYVSYGNESDYENKNPEDSIVIIDRGQISFNEKYKTAVSKGTRAVIIVNNIDEPVTMQLDDLGKVPVISIPKNEGDKIKNKESLLSLSCQKGYSVIDNPNAGKISNFSSFGPSPDLELLPEITAPGGCIYSTVNENEHASLSGTSMAAPNVSGCAALLIQSIKEKGLNLSDDKKVDFIKATLMNTAEPVMEDENIPYSPRRQGAGEIKIEKAMTNNVIATDDRNKPSLCLKNIGDKTKFTIKLKNYGNIETSYLLSSSGLYTESVENGIVKEKKIEGANIIFDNNSVVVNPNGEMTINGSLSIDPSMLNKQNFVEGYVKLSSLSSNVPSLSLPVLAFYGNYDNEKIIDDPITSSSSLTKVTGLGERGKNFVFNYYGQDEDGKINEEDVSFSPGLSKEENDSKEDDASLDNYRDTVSCNTYFLRSAKEFEMQVLDQYKNFVTKDQIYNNTIKNSLYDKNLKGAMNYRKYKYTWDGKKYNTSTGKYELLPDGKYYIRLKAKGYVDSSIVQTIDMPVKLDTTKPDLELLEASYEGNYYLLKWKASDYNSGLKEGAAACIYGDETSYKKLTDVSCEDGVYSGKYEYSKQDSGILQLCVSDNAGNLCYKNAELGNDGYVFYWNFNDGSHVSSEDYTIIGNISPCITRVTVNGYDADMSKDEDMFTQTIKLSEGNNDVTVKAYAYGEVVSSKECNIILDSKKPIINSIEPLGQCKDTYYVVNDSVINLTLNIQDGNNVKGMLYNESTYRESDVYDGSLGKINIPCNLRPGWNKILLLVYDDLNNCEQKYINILKADDSILNAGFCNINDGDILSKNSCKDDVLELNSYVTDDKYSIYINGIKAIKNEDQTFTSNVKLNEGENLIRLEVKDSSSNTVFTKTNKVIYDSISPKVTFSNLPQADANGKVKAADSKFVLRGSVSESVYDYSLSINDSQVFRTYTGSSNDKEALSRDFSYEINLKNGKNVIKVTTTDEFNQNHDDYLEIYYGDTTANSSDDFNIYLFIAIIMVSSMFIYKNRIKIKAQG